MVIISHIPLLCRNQGVSYFNDLPIFHKGTEAIYVFFVLSGYLIIRLIFREKQANKFSVKRFYMRRILRIFPLYYLIVLFGFLFYNFILPQLGIEFDINYNLIDGLLLTTFFLPNVFSELYDPGSILLILWSIGIEEQFYLIIAPLLFISPKQKVIKILAILLVLYFVFFHLNAITILTQFKLVFFFLFFGGLVAIMEEKGLLNVLKRIKLFPVLIAVIFVVYFATDYFEFNSKWLTNLFAMVLFGLFIHTISSNNRGFEVKNTTLNYFGAISYGIYMYHVIALNAVVFIVMKFKDVDIINDNFMIILINIFTFALTLFMAHLSYTYFESYFLKLKHKFRK